MVDYLNRQRQQKGNRVYSCSLKALKSFLFASLFFTTDKQGGAVKVVVLTCLHKP